ncbi:hypothetical protein PUR61_10315 [Streptomyces sp. BE20]|nr:MULTISPECIES: hypothetical protein [unclassified Streptomyces]MED7949763.1 hypothetical protein [Streptomyces sp. BE303]MEE1822581.1 hypothetical protein [Streptomyces sp. BE20]
MLETVQGAGIGVLPGRLGTTIGVGGDHRVQPQPWGGGDQRAWKAEPTRP